MKRNAALSAVFGEERCAATGKVIIPSEHAARLAARRLREQGHGLLKPYRCDACHGLHIGH